MRPNEGLHIESLAKRYGDAAVFQGVDLHVAPGEFVAIVGESGVGKSSLLNCMAALDTPTSGRVVIDGVEMRRMGQSGTLGRYPLHWHMLGEAAGHAVRNSAVWQSSQRCIVLHATNGVQVQNNVCHDVAGHAFFLEDAVERRNLLFRQDEQRTKRFAANLDRILVDGLLTKLPTKQ